VLTLTQCFYGFFAENTPEGINCVPALLNLLFGRILSPKYFCLAFYASCGKMNHDSFFACLLRDDIVVVILVEIVNA